MDTPLFPDLPEVLSPRLAWMRRHAVETEHLPEGGSESPETGEYIPNWVCRTIKPKGNFYYESQIGGGGTEDEAILDFCKNSGIKHWSVT